MAIAPCCVISAVAALATKQLSLLHVYSQAVTQQIQARTLGGNSTGAPIVNRFLYTAEHQETTDTMFVFWYIKHTIIGLYAQLHYVLPHKVVLDDCKVWQTQPNHVSCGCRSNAVVPTWKDQLSHTSCPAKAGMYQHLLSF